MREKITADELVRDYGYGAFTNSKAVSGEPRCSKI